MAGGGGRGGHIPADKMRPLRAPGSPAAPSPLLCTWDPCPGALTAPPPPAPSLLRWNRPGCTPDPGGRAEHHSHCERGWGPHGCGECSELGAEGARLAPVSLRKAKPKGCGTSKTPQPGSQDPSTQSQEPPTRESGPLNQGVRIPPTQRSGHPHPGVRFPPPGSQDPPPGTVGTPPPGVRTPRNSGESGPFTQDSQYPST